jgi:hypothetical protein
MAGLIDAERYVPRDEFPPRSTVYNLNGTML